MGALLQLTDDEEAATIIAPHFDAVRDFFAEHEIDNFGPLSRLGHVKLIVDPAMHDSERHFAGCTDDGTRIHVAPQAADLPTQNLVAILVHEFGHAADFTYAGRWLFVSRDEPAQWIDEPSGRAARKARKLWHSRDDDQVEWAADSIALAITGKRIGYCGRCMIQCFSGKPRPAGLR